MVWVDLLLHQNKLQEASAFVDKNFNGTSAVDLQVLSKASRSVEMFNIYSERCLICFPLILIAESFGRTN